MALNSQSGSVPAESVLQGSRAAARAASDLEDAAGLLLGHCMAAFHAFRDLRELSEDMRILSLNAELAAGRAGTAGVAVRALTQYTRQLVSQLARLRNNMEALKSDTYGLSASTLRALQELRLIELASGHIAVATPEDAAAAESGQRAVKAAEESVFATAIEHLQRMMDHAQDLGIHAGRIRQVAEQSAGIATNIAIEAAGAGAHEPEFRNVADTMKRYIGALRAMVERADQAVQMAGKIGHSLSQRLARTSRA